MGFAEDMAELETAWKEAPAEREGDFGPIMPDGGHQALITEAEVRQRESDEHWQLFLRFQNRVGAIRKWSDLDHEVGLRVAKADAILLGFPADAPLSKLEKACADFVGLVCDIKVVTKPGNERDFTNTYLNRCHGRATDTSIFDVDPSLAASAQADAADAAPVASDDDIPF